MDVIPFLLHQTWLGPGPCGAGPALCTDQGQQSHVELWQAVRRVARALQALGVCPGDRVAIALPRSFEAVQAIFGTLLTGGVYVPIDVTAPVERLSFLIADIEPRLLIATDDVVARLEPGGPARVVLGQVGSGEALTAALDVARFGTPSRGLEASGADPWPTVDLDAPAAMLYTSGSTGRPKGAVLSHRNISSFVSWAIRCLKFDSSDRFVSHAPLHFDLSTLDLFAPMRLGASVYLPDAKTVRFPAALSKALERQRSTVLYCVPTALRLLLEYGNLKRRDLAALRQVLFAGEVFPIAGLRALMHTLPQVKFVNLYGPTETNVCTYHVLSGPPDEAARSIPIGKPCEHLEVFIAADAESGSFEPASAGATGEICVRGANVFSGYHRRAEATAQSRVLADEHSYRTGDFGYMDESGAIWFAGRRDLQIKIRGHRVELLEVERVLVAHPGVRDAACVVSEPEALEARIVAFVATSDSSLTAEVLTFHCQAQLMSYAVPKEFVVLERLPVNSNGKIDRQALLGTLNQGAAAQASALKSGQLSSAGVAETSQEKRP